MSTGKSLQDLGLTEEALPAQSFDDLPDFGGFAPPPQPGPYRFTLPGDLSAVWDLIDTVKGQRIRMVLDRDAPLLIAQSPGGKVNNETFQTRLSNVERKRGKDGPEASDLDYLLRALGVKTRPTTNKAYILAVSALAGKTFGADITYSFQCREDKPIYVYDTDGTLKPVEGSEGCGKRYYQKDLTRDEKGEFPIQLQCTGRVIRDGVETECGAILRGFANLENLRS